MRTREMSSLQNLREESVAPVDEESIEIGGPELNRKQARKDVARRITDTQDLLLELLDTCSSNMRSLVSVEGFNVNHLKKCMENINTIVQALQRSPSTTFSGPAFHKVFKEIFQLIIDLSAVSRSVQYRNRSVFIKLFALFRVVEILYIPTFEVSYVSLQEITLYSYGLGHDTKSMLSTDNVYGLFVYFLKTGKIANIVQTNEDQFIQRYCETFILQTDRILPHLYQLMRKLKEKSETRNTVNSIILEAHRSPLHHELVSLVLSSQKDILLECFASSKGEYIESRFHLLFDMAAETILKTGNKSDHLVDDIPSELRSRIMDKSVHLPTIIAQVLAEAIDQSLVWENLENSGTLKLLYLTLGSTLNSLNTTEQYMIIFEKCMNLTLSLPATLCQLIFILVKTLTKIKRSAGEDTIQIPSSVENVFLRKTPPVSKMGLTEKPVFDLKDQANKMLLVQSLLVDTIGSCAKLLQVVLKPFLIAESALFQDQEINSTLKFKCDKVFCRLVLSAVICLEIFRQNMKYQQLPPVFKNMGAEIVLTMSSFYKKVFVSEKLSAFLHICHVDLKLVKVCSELYELCLRDTRFKRIIFGSQVCYHMTVQFINEFYDPRIASQRKIKEILREDEVFGGSHEVSYELLCEIEILEELLHTKSKVTTSNYSKVGLNDAAMYGGAHAGTESLSQSSVSSGYGLFTNEENLKVALSMNATSSVANSQDQEKYLALSTPFHASLSAMNMDFPKEYQAYNEYSPSPHVDPNNTTSTSLEKGYRHQSTFQKAPQMTMFQYQEESASSTNYSSSGVNINELKGPTAAQQKPNTSRSQSVHIDKFIKYA